MLSSIKSLRFMHNLLAGERENILNYPYKPQKPEYTKNTQQAPLSRATPEAVGVPSQHLINFFEEVCSKTGLNAHNIMMIKNGKVFCEASFAPYRQDVWHITHSMCKSITSIAIGLLISEGKLRLQDKAVDILKNKSLIIANPAMRKITIENLLCMSSGVDYRELGIIADEDWLKGYFKARVDFEPGSKFAYNSINSYVLSCIIKKVSGQGIMQYLAPRIFEPLKITNIKWELSATEIEKGGWGLYITIEDIAKLGLLMLQNGKWKVDGVEKQLLPSEYIAIATQTHLQLKDERNDLEYGYHFWTRKSDGMYQFNGMLGQYVVVLPKHNIVVAMNSGCCNLANHSHALSCIDKYFSNVESFCEKSITQNIIEYKKLKRAIDNLQYEQKFCSDRQSFLSWYRTNVMSVPKTGKIPSLAYCIDKFDYVVQDNAVGLLPLVLQCVNNNMGKGLDKISFSVQKEELIVVWQENEIEYKIPVVDGNSREFVIDYNGEVFLASTISRMLINEDDLLVLKITVALLESSCARKIKFIFNGNKMQIILDEDPHIDDVISNFTLAENWQLELLELKDKRYAKYRLAQILSPSLEADLNT